MFIHLYQFFCWGNFDTSMGIYFIFTLNMILSFVYFILWTLLSLYLAINVWVIWAWYKQDNIDAPKLESEAIPLSILIAIRNEAQTIQALIKQIDAQNYPKTSFEIIVIDDHSDDDSIELIKALNIQNLRLIKNEGQGKKAAIQTGLKIARNPYIVQTDADCSMGNDWLISLSTVALQSKFKLAMAPVVFKSNTSLFSKLQELEFYAIMMSTAGLARQKHAVMANGANLIYPKNVAQDFDLLQQKTSSGDDIFLLHHIKKKYGRASVHFIKSKKATVYTHAAPNLKSFIAQRLRWASKSKYYKDSDTILFGLLMAFVNMALVFLFLGCFFRIIPLGIFVEFLFVKILADFILLRPILRFYQKEYLLIYFPILFLVYPFYVSFVAVLSPFKSFEWKGRTYR